MRNYRRKDYRCRCGVTTIKGALRCAACKYADIVAFEGSHTSDGLPVTCWCEASFAFVKPALIKAGLTRSCGLEGCGPEVVAA